MRSLLFVLASLHLLLVACGEDPGDPVVYTWAEEEEDDNGNATSPEVLDLNWNPELRDRLTVTGTMTACDYDPQEDWPWQGDEDNFLLEVPADGALELTVDWDDADSDLDLLIYAPPPRPPNISPDVQLTSLDKPIEYVFRDDVREGDEIVFGVVCAEGAPTDYTITFLLEL